MNEIIALIARHPTWCVSVWHDDSDSAPWRITIDPRTKGINNVWQCRLTERDKQLRPIVFSAFLQKGERAVMHALGESQTKESTDDQTPQRRQQAV